MLPRGRGEHAEQSLVTDSHPHPGAPPRRREDMRVVYTRCAGLDVHKKSVVACVLTPAGQQTRTFGTTTRHLLQLADWLREHHVTNVAMESTGVSWKPRYNLLEAAFTVWVVNAYHVKQVPGRKTDVKDAEWIADLLRHGLLRPSFIPDRPQREVRELVRYRTSLVQERSRAVNRLQQVLEGANSKLASVATDVPACRAGQCCRPWPRARPIPRCWPRWPRAGCGRNGRRWSPRWPAASGPTSAFCWGCSCAASRRWRRNSATWMRSRPAGPPAAGRLDRRGYHPGGGPAHWRDDRRRTGRRHEPVSHPGSPGVVGGGCPGNHRSAERRKRRPTKRGNRALPAALVEAARAAARTRTYLGAQYHRLARLIGANRPPWPWRTASRSSCTTASAPGSRMSTAATTTSSSATKPSSPAVRCANWNAWATPSPSKRPKQAIFRAMTSAWGR